ncbi:CATRA system-associated protein [Streptomyces europaeiscabiei]|uniref:CATRA system-associated protein n=1 Tax=Streptomyces europaeiscabiei TaxID=146819 RepID=UPI002E162A16|nr:hypothetical protein OHB30_07905 [Streptomyces europaeiscabiei]
MSGNVRITLVTRDSLLDGTPVHVQIIDALHQQVRTEIARVGVPRQLELPEGAYAVRVLLPSGNVVESGFLIPAHSRPDPVAIDLASQPPHPWLEPTAVLGPSDQAGFDDLTRPAFATAWVRLWACRGSTWNVVPWPHPQVLRSAHGVRFTFHGLDVVPHAVQVGTASTPWHITLLPLSTAPLVTVRPAVRPEHLRVSVLTAAVDALLGYGAVGDTRAAELIANSFTGDPSAVLTHLGSIGLGYHLLNSSSGGGPSPEMLLGAAGTPDGAVLSAWVLLERMRSGSTKQSVEQVCLAFLRAAATGLPSLAQGLVRLIDGLRLAASSHTPYREDARSVLAEYARYLAHTDMTSPLLAFHGSRPDTPGQWNPGTAEIPYGAVRLTSPSSRESPTASVSAMLPGDLVLRAISTLDMGLEWRMPATRWTEASEIVDTLKQALAGSDWPVLADATETLRRLFSLRGNAVGSVRAPEWIGPPMRELLGRCSVLCGRSLELPRPAPTVGPTALPQTAAAGPSEETEGPSTPDNDSVVSLYATAVDAQDAAPLETCISQFRQLLDTVQGGDPLRATVLVNYAIALWTLNEWTDEVSPQGDPARSLAEAASLSPPGTETFHRRVSCLHAVRIMRLQGRESVRTDTTTTGLAKVLVPETAERPGEPLELQIKTAEPTQDVPPRRTLRSSPGGLRDSITEDLATGLDIHRTRNPATGRRWRSVYTADILAVGEGPSNWTDYITQQLRWSRGTYETIFKQMPRALFSLSPGRLLHYTLTVSYYPLTAMNWVLGALSCSIFVLLGTGSVDIDTSVWLTLYGNAFALQGGFYIWNRRHNVSPHEPEGSSGLSGMLMSALAAPVYVRGLLDAVLRRHSEFVVTPKGDAASPDRLWTFSLHLPWTLLYLVLVVYAFFPGRINPVGAFWSGIGLVLSAMPVVWWLAERRRRTVVRRASGHGSRTSPDDPKDGPVIPEQPSPVPMEGAQSVPPTQHGRSKDPFDS